MKGIEMGKSIENHTKQEQHMLEIANMQDELEATNNNLQAEKSAYATLQKQHNLLVTDHDILKSDYNTLDDMNDDLEETNDELKKRLSSACAIIGMGIVKDMLGEE